MVRKRRSLSTRASVRSGTRRSSSSRANFASVMSTLQPV
jgi:hypothetical protein